MYYIVYVLSLAVMKPKLEYISHKLDGEVYAFTYQNTFFDAPWHYHEDYELTYIEKGRGIRHVAGSVDHFVPGDLVLVGKGVPHFWRNESGYAAGVVSHCVQWESASLESFIHQTEALQPIAKLLKAAQNGVKFRDATFSLTIGNRLKKLESLPAEERIVELLQLLLKLAKHQEKELLSVNTVRYHLTEKSNTRIATLLNYVDVNFHQKITLDQMAALTYMTKAAFCKYFKKEFKKTFTNYLNEYRIRKACLLLQETDENLLSIALNCGYENMSFFHRQFKKYLGLTPKEYRQKISETL